MLRESHGSRSDRRNRDGPAGARASHRGGRGLGPGVPRRPVELEFQVSFSKVDFAEAACWVISAGVKENRPSAFSAQDAAASGSGPPG
jgi:hypothetical protein